MLASPERHDIVEAEALGNVEGSTVRSARVWDAQPTGVKEEGMFTMGFPRNLGGLIGLTQEQGPGVGHVISDNDRLRARTVPTALQGAFDSSGTAGAGC